MHGKRAWTIYSSLLALFACVLLGCQPAAGLFPTRTPSLYPTPAALASLRAAPTPRTRGLSDAARAYLNGALDILQQNSVRREQVDWPRLRANAFEQAGAARVPADTYDAIRQAIDALGDHHSKFYAPERAALLKQLKLGDNAPPEARPLGPRLAYLRVPGFVTLNGEQRHLYASQLQSLIREADAQNPCGWVLDLRENTGGNIWPMLAGLGPLLGEGAVGAFVYPDGEKQSWIYQSGEARLQARVLEWVDGAGYTLRHARPPVAVLLGPRTLSAGEAVAIAFRGRPDTRSFGLPTGGLSTANATYELSDGAAIALTVVTDADRTGRTFGGAVQPDEVIRTDTTAGDGTLHAATDWLGAQPACHFVSPVPPQLGP